MGLFMMLIPELRVAKIPVKAHQIQPGLQLKARLDNSKSQLLGRQAPFFYKSVSQYLQPLFEKYFKISDGASFQDHVPVGALHPWLRGGNRGHFRHPGYRTGFTSTAAQPSKGKYFGLDRERDKRLMTLGAGVAHNFGLGCFDRVVIFVTNGAKPGATHRC